MSNGEKPDGYVAWHPNEQLMTEFDSFSWWEKKCFQNLEIHAKVMVKLGIDITAEEYLDGWRIRPVKLVFLDTEDND